MTSKALATIDFSPTLAVPDNAPPLSVDVANPHLSLDDLFPENFFSMAGLEKWLKDRKADARVLTVTGASMELLYDPSNGEKPKDGRWLPCLSFEGCDTLLVINKSRAAMLADIAQSPLLAAWAKVGTIAIKPGIGNGKAQIVIERPPQNGESLDNLNSDLFG